MGYYLGGGLCLLIAVIGFFALGAARRKREDILGTETYGAGEIEDVYKTMKEEMIDGDFSFPCQLKGMIRAENPLKAPLSGKRGVWRRSLVERQRQETSWDTDDQGRRTKRTRQFWETVSDETDRCDFYIVDETGRTLVRSRGAKIIGEHLVHDRYEKEPGYGETRVLGHRRREWLIPMDVPVYALGHVTDEGGELAMQHVGKDSRYFISLKGERELVEHLGGKVRFWKVGVPIFGVLGVLLIILGIFEPF